MQLSSCFAPGWPAPCSPAPGPSASHRPGCSALLGWSWSFKLTSCKTIHPSIKAVGACSCLISNRTKNTSPQAVLNKLSGNLLEETNPQQPNNLIFQAEDHLCVGRSFSLYVPIHAVNRSVQDHYKSHCPGFTHLTLSISDSGLQSPQKVYSSAGANRCSLVLGIIPRWNESPVPAPSLTLNAWLLESCCYVWCISKLISVFSLLPKKLPTSLKIPIWRRKWTWRNQENKEGNCHFAPWLQT